MVPDNDPEPPGGMVDAVAKDLQSTIVYFANKVFRESVLSTGDSNPEQPGNEPAGEQPAGGATGDHNYGKDYGDLVGVAEAVVVYTALDVAKVALVVTGVVVAFVLVRRAVAK